MLLTSNEALADVPVLVTVNVTLPLLPTSTTPIAPWDGCRVSAAKGLTTPVPVKLMSVPPTDPAVTDSTAETGPSAVG